MTNEHVPLLARLRSALRHAFAVESRVNALPTEEERETIERILEAIVRRNLVGPTIVFLESMRPMNFVSAQAIHYFTPLVGMVVDREALHRFGRYLERRGSVEWMCMRLEALEAESVERSANTSRVRTLDDTERSDL